MGNDRRIDVFDILDLTMIAAVQTGLILPDKINNMPAVYSSDTAYRFARRFEGLLCERFQYKSAEEMWQQLAKHNANHSAESSKKDI